MECFDVLMGNGEFFEGKRIGELADYIIEKFSDEKLSMDEAMEVLKTVKNAIGGYAIIQNRP